ncbi:MAG: hypothetical protein COW29_11440 [Rhodobacterales bacterium CG15_BIG_FIL_POST_REV_8_21_14_020_59_13]|nr:MAG: hypothetical protein COW29_11440 [Rhodobacterales bacterium CG15_BIG_FIL_POST_REV_8_21_14_020_59_13]
MSDSEYIVSIDLLGLPGGDTTADRERRVAVSDLLEANHFSPEGDNLGPYNVNLSIDDGKLAIDIRTETGEAIHTFMFSLGPFRGIFKDYFMICESYHEAVRDSSLAQIEAIDMGRRGVHNEGAELLLERFMGKIDVDFETARRLFTLIGALHHRPGSS